MNRPVYVWGAFALAVALLAYAVGWISQTALQAERNEARAIKRAALEESVRLALWRMDSTVGALVAQESARAYFQAAEDAPYVLAHFQLDARDQLITPAPVPAERLAKLRAFLHPNELRAVFPKGPEEPDPEPEVVQNQALSDDLLSNSLSRSASEFRARTMNAYQQRAFTKSRAPEVQQQMPRASPAMIAGPIKPFFLSGELLLARAVKIGSRQLVQGCWLDWASLRGDLLKSVKDLLPLASLEPHVPEPQPRADGPDPSHQMASIPALLVPGDDGRVSEAPVSLGEIRRSPLGLSLMMAWGAVALAAVAVAALLLGVLSLSERRAAFVSAVTHELRTPLTTFQLYTDLLSDDLVTDPDKRRGYVETLRREAKRLGHLVENVLAYARLERGKSGRRLEPVQVGALMERCAPRLMERAKAGGMELVIEMPDAMAERTLVTDAAAVEQVLFNLVDNACKYAAGAEDRRLTVMLTWNARRSYIAVRDRGPGISRAEGRKLFLPFSRSAEQAAGSAPGVGLGLALSRQLARQLGGDLVLDTPREGPGAMFTLSLP